MAKNDSALGEKGEKRKVSAAEKVVNILKVSSLSFNESIRVLNYVRFIIGEHLPKF